MANELCDLFRNIGPCMERSFIFNRKIIDGTAEYQSDLNELLKTFKLENKTKFFKSLLRPDDSN